MGYLIGIGVLAIVLCSFYILKQKVSNTDDEINQFVMDKGITEDDLKKALERNEFTLFYQPKLHLRTCEITGAEALIRWEHPQKGLIPPNEFIPIAEATGMILPIGKWALHTACEQTKEWQQEGLPEMVISVNLSGGQLFHPNLAEEIQRILQEVDLSPQFLELEVTESMMMDFELGIQALNELKNIGVQISLDDFGTGYSSLSYLKDLPIDKLKIDQSFVYNCTEDTKDETIVKTIIAMSHELDLGVVAEGVETKGHLLKLQNNLCDEAQGFFFSKPLPSEEFVRRYNEIQDSPQVFSLSKEISREKEMEKLILNAQNELTETVRQQQGMIFKYEKVGDRFIHTLCDGELLYKIGLIPEKVVGKELKDIMPYEDIQPKLSYYERAWNGEDHVSYEGKFADVYYLASLRPVRKGGEVKAVIGSCVDITERKQIEKELIQSESMHRFVLDHVNDLIITLDPHDIIMYASPSVEEILGYPVQDIIGNSIQNYMSSGFLKKEKLDSSNDYHEQLQDINGNMVDVEIIFDSLFDDDGHLEKRVLIGRPHSFVKI
ncbi:EAL domain-containing protein [Pontibacillus sp. HMF3514]|uniref:EAL domain-containing protein n=1 Tax=Pontibacillus sp. HMF3514 TaxID=2692425 RepID=UPI00131F6AA0|nr:EAL domain-containing protein [Pontibacillus sp. HMF3514]QHE52851.1 EAL domain-containing protein [Pontibacillus sp. HMF3514]